MTGVQIMKYRYQHLKYGSYEEILASYHDPVGGRTLCCAHRSYWHMYPENSALAILAAMDFGCDMIEIDVRATKDGVCVLSHDNNLGRCTNADPELAMRNLDEIEYEQIRHLRLRFGTGGKNTMVSDEHICLFEEALLLCENRALINLDKVMEDDRLRECVYRTMLRLDRQGHKPFEFCIFKCGNRSLTDVLEWIREKEASDGVKINYVPWGVHGAEYLVKNGYHPYLFEYRWDLSKELTARKEQIGVGYMANTFADTGEDTPAHWRAAMQVGANVLHSDDGRLCPKVIRQYWAETYTVSRKCLQRYQGPGGDMILPAGIRTVASGAFAGCSDLKSIILPQGIERVEERAFADCTSLRIAVLPAGVRFVGKHAFPAGTVICTPASKAVAAYAQSEHLHLVEYPEHLPYTFEIRNEKISLTRYLGSETDVVIPDTLLELPVYEIGKECFSHTGVKSVRLGDNTEMIEQYAFSDCRELRTVIFKKSIRAIAMNAFDRCDRAMTVVSPAGSYPNRYAKAKGIRCAQSAEEPIGTVVFDGEGTAEAPFRIACTEDLLRLSDILQRDARNFYANACYLQTADLSLDGNEACHFDPIGRDGGVFCGVYDGGGHTVRGICIQSSAEGASLFGYISGAEIRNVNTENIAVTASALIGGLVGVAEYSVIRNCHARHFRLCATNTDHCNVGGLIGAALHCTVSDCSAECGSITGYRDLGGFMGEANHTVVTDCRTDRVADLEGQGNSCGGFVGNFKGASRFENCYTAVNVSGALRVGAFSGFSGCDKRAEMKHCVALGNVKSCVKCTHGGLTGARVASVVDCYYSDLLENMDCCQGTAISPVEIKLEAIFRQGEAVADGS